MVVLLEVIQTLTALVTVAFAARGLWAGRKARKSDSTSESED